MQKVAETHYAEIFIAGDIITAKQICRKFCNAVGLCVTVESLSFIYTDGQEEGVKVGLTNYPRFPTAPDKLQETAMLLAEELRAALCQASYLVRCADKTYWSTKR